jgi:hypothetical protein
MKAATRSRESLGGSIAVEEAEETWVETVISFNKCSVSKLLLPQTIPGKGMLGLGVIPEL